MKNCYYCRLIGCLFCFFGIFFTTVAQNQTVLDSLFEQLQMTKEPTTKIDLLNAIAGEYIASQPLLGANYAQQALTEGEKYTYQCGIADAYKQLAGSCYFQGNMLKNSEYLIKALPIYEKLKDTANIAKVLGYLGSVYEAQGNTDKQIEYFYKALRLARLVKDQKFVATLLSNGLGNAYKTRNQMDSALLCQVEALKIREKIQDTWGLANSFLYIGQIYWSQKDYVLAENYFQKSLEMSQQINDQYGLCVATLHKGNLQLEQNHSKKALVLYLQSLKIAENAQLKPQIKECCEKLAQTFTTLKQFEDAYQYLRWAVRMNDTLNNQENKKKIAEMQASFEMQQRQRQIEQQNASKERQNNIQYSGILLFTMLLFSCAFIFGKFQIADTWVEKLLFFSFLLLFEFIIILTDPYIDILTKKEPLLTLLANACLAVLIVPLHQFLENKLRHKWLN